MEFSTFNLEDDLLRAIEFMGFTSATPVQQEAIPAVLRGQDLLACAQTGTGKTAAFLLPIMNAMVNKTDSHIGALILVPTRELAIQIEKEIQGLSYFISVGSMALYGGGSGDDFSQQKQALKEGRDIIVATPGKLISHLNLGHLNLSHLKYLILDEADKMLDMGFQEDLYKIFSFLPAKRQNLFFSATMPHKMEQLAKRYLHHPHEIKLNLSKPAEGVDQKIFLVHEGDKYNLLTRLLSERESVNRIILFTSSKDKVYQITQQLHRNKFQAKSISSNLSQDEREEVLRLFRADRIPILVATDVLSRGIDIKDIALVLNFDCPPDAEDYVHRVGRTARAQTKGEAITFVNEKDRKRLADIERLIDRRLPIVDLPEGVPAGPPYDPSFYERKKSNKPFRKKNFKPRKKD